MINISLINISLMICRKLTRVVLQNLTGLGTRPLPLSPGEVTLSWLGFASNGLLCSADSAGIVRAMIPDWNFRWSPIANLTTAPNKGDNETLALIGVVLKPEMQVRCFILFLCLVSTLLLPWQRTEASGLLFGQCVTTAHSYLPVQIDPQEPSGSAQANAQSSRRPTGPLGLGRAGQTD